MGKHSWYIVALFLVLQNRLLSHSIENNLSSEQLSFITVHSPPLLLFEQCNKVFNHMILYEKIKDTQTNEKSLLDYLTLAKFLILKTDIVNKSKKYKGDLKIIAEHPMINDYIIKMQLPLSQSHQPVHRRSYNLSRLQGRTIINDTLVAMNCSSIVTPKKYLYHIPQSPSTLKDENYIVLSEKIPITLIKNSEPNNTFIKNKKKFIAYLKRLIKKTGYFDSKLENIYSTLNDKIAIIDTEDSRGFWSPNRPFSWIKGINLFFESILGKMNLARLDK